MEEELSDIDPDFQFHYSQQQTTGRAFLVNFTSSWEEHKDTLLSAINAITKQSFLAKCQVNFLRARKESLTANEMIVLGDFVENYSSLCKMKSEVTIGVKNTAHYTHSLYILLTVMEIFNTILFHNFVDKIQTILVDYLEGNLPIVDKIFYFSNGCAEWSMFNGQCSC